jgi:hypothetical protein
VQQGKYYDLQFMKLVVEEFIYSRTSLIQIKWDSEPSRYAETPDNWIFLWRGYVGILKWEKVSTNGGLGYIFIYIQIKH